MLIPPPRGWDAARPARDLVQNLPWTVEVFTAALACPGPTAVVVVVVVVGNLGQERGDGACSLWAVGFSCPGNLHLCGHYCFSWSHAPSNERGRLSPSFDPR